MTSPITTSRHTSSSRRGTDGAFTLVELVIVLLIITAMVTVAVPYATRSNEGLALDQACRDVAEGMKYAMSHAAETRRPTRFAVDLAQKSYAIEALEVAGEPAFEPLKDARGRRRYLGTKVHIVDVEGFAATGKNQYALVFDPVRPWPHASVALGIKDTLTTVHVAGKVVRIEQQPG